MLCKQVVASCVHLGVRARRARKSAAVLPGDGIAQLHGGDNAEEPQVLGVEALRLPELHLSTLLWREDSSWVVLEVCLDACCRHNHCSGVWSSLWSVKFVSPLLVELQLHFAAGGLVRERRADATKPHIVKAAAQPARYNHSCIRRCDGKPQLEPNGYGSTPCRFAD